MPDDGTRRRTWDDRAMVHAIVEGEPGIFPDPVARILRGIGGLFRRRPAEPADDAPPPPGPSPGRPTGEGEGRDGE
jgi:hypothetical protein